MQEHPVPQNVTTFEFKLIGDMTLRQFGYVATGAIIAFVTYVSPTPSQFIFWSVKAPIVLGSLGIGFALAFMPIEGRPLDRWIVAFFKATFGNTLYVWKKEGIELPALHDLMATVRVGAGPLPPQVVQTQPRVGSPPKRVVAGHQMVRPQLAKQPIDRTEHQALHQVTMMRPDVVHTLAGPTHKKTPISIISQVPSRIASFAGDTKPLGTIPAPVARPTMPQTPIFPTHLRAPSQKPLAPKKIILPSYQQDHAQPQAPNQPSAGQAHLINSLYSGETNQPAPMPNPTITSPVPPAASQPPNFKEAASKTDTGQAATPKPTAPKPPKTDSGQVTSAPTPNTEVTQLKQENQDLYQKLSSVTNPNDLTTAKKESQGLQDQLNMLEHTLSQYKQDISKISAEQAEKTKAGDARLQQALSENAQLEQKMKTLENDTQKLTAVESQATSLQEKLANEEAALQKSQQEKTELEQRLLALEQEHEKAAQAPVVPPIKVEPITLTMPAPAIPVPQPTSTPQPAPEPAVGAAASAPIQAPPLASSTQPNFSIVTPQVVINQAAPTPEVKPTISDQNPIIFDNNPPPISTPPLEKSPETKPDQPEQMVSFEAKSTAPPVPIPNAISGFVVDEEKHPLTGTIVVIKKVGGPTMRALRSNKVGQFAMVSPLPDGKYEATFEKEGYSFDALPFEANGKTSEPVTIIGRKAS